MFIDREIEANQSRMESARSGFDMMREELAALLLPHHDHFSHQFAGTAVNRTSTPYDEYAALALQDGVSAFEGFTMPRGQKWQGIAVANEELMGELVVQQWLEAVQTRLFGLRNDPRSGFTNAVHEGVESLYALGEQSLWVDKRHDERGRVEGISYQAEPIYAIFVELDDDGNVIRVHKKFSLSAEAAWLKWKDLSPPKVRAAMEARPPRRDQAFEFLHVIERNPNVVTGRLDAAGMPWRGCYYSIADKLHFVAGGYRVLRRIVSRWQRASGRHYGTGPSRLVLGAIRAAQVMMQDRVMATEMAVKPPLLAEDDDLDQGIIDLSPLGITYGGMENGNAKLKALFTSIDLSGAEALHGEVRQIIDRAMYRHLMQINREAKTHMIQARVLEEIAEKGVLLSPLARQEKELFAPMLDAELDIMWDIGLLDDMPMILRRWFTANGGVQATYDNELSRMMQAAEAAGYFRMSEQVVAIGQYAPEAIAAFTREYPPEKVVAGLGRVNGVPARWRATDDEKAARDQAVAEQAQVQQLLEAAPVLGQAGKNIVEAERMANGA